MENNLKLFKNDKDIIIESLVERTKDLSFLNEKLKKRIEDLKVQINFFDKYSKELSNFKHYLKWKEKTNNMIENIQYIDIEVLNDGFNKAIIDKDIDKIICIWEQYMKIPVCDLIDIIHDKDLEIERLNIENEELKNELEI